MRQRGGFFVGLRDLEAGPGVDGLHCVQGKGKLLRRGPRPLVRMGQHRQSPGLPDGLHRSLRRGQAPQRLQGQGPLQEEPRDVARRRGDLAPGDEEHPLQRRRDRGAEVVVRDGDGVQPRRFGRLGDAL